MNNKLLLLVTGLLLFSIPSLSKDKDKLSKFEEKLIGTWQIDSIKFGQGFATKGRKENKRKSPYYIRKHKGAILTFHEDKTVTYILPADTNVYEGTWETYFSAGYDYAPNTIGVRGMSRSYSSVTISLYFEGMAKRHNLEGSFRWWLNSDSNHKYNSFGFADRIHYFVFKKINEEKNQTKQ